MIKTRSVINCKIAYSKIAIYLFLSVELIKFAHKKYTAFYYGYKIENRITSSR